MNAPWIVSDSTGYGRMVDLETYSRAVDSSIKSFERDSRSVMGSRAPHALAIAQFARDRELWIKRDEKDGGEIWTLLAEYDRMDRVVVILIRRAEWAPTWEITVRTGANWVGGESGTYSTLVERRWFGFTDEAPVATFAETLDIALADAKSYTTSDLLPRAEVVRLQRPWR